LELEDKLDTDEGRSEEVIIPELEFNALEDKINELFEDEDFGLLEIGKLVLDEDVQRIELKFIDWFVVGVPNPNILSRFPVISSLAIVVIVKSFGVLRNC
jgi:hypothetical protein